MNLGTNLVGHRNREMYARKPPASPTTPHLSTFLTLFLLIVLTALHCPVSLQLCRMQRQARRGLAMALYRHFCTDPKEPSPKTLARPVSKTSREVLRPSEWCSPGAKCLLASVKHSRKPRICVRLRGLSFRHVRFEHSNRPAAALLARLYVGLAFLLHYTARSDEHLCTLQPVTI